MTLAGAKAHDAPSGSPEQASVIGPVKPPVEVTRDRVVHRAIVIDLLLRRSRGHGEAAAIGSSVPTTTTTAATTATAAATTTATASTIRDGKRAVDFGDDVVRRLGAGSGGIGRCDGILPRRAGGDSRGAEGGSDGLARHYVDHRAGERRVRRVYRTRLVICGDGDRPGDNLQDDGRRPSADSLRRPNTKR